LKPVIFLAAWFVCRADTIELKTGERLEGTFKEATAAGVVIEVGGQAITMPMEKVRAIYFGRAVPVGQSQDQAGPALDALKALQSATSTGVNYRAYASMVVDTKVKTDKYSASANDDPRRASINAAMRFYELASQAWGATISRNPDSYYSELSVGKAVIGEPVISECPVIRNTIADLQRGAAKNKLLKVDASFLGVWFGSHPAPLWTCANLQMTAAGK
jgi:hypothetical protein